MLQLTKHKSLVNSLVCWLFSQSIQLIIKMWNASITTSLSPLWRESNSLNMFNTLLYKIRKSRTFSHFKRLEWEVLACWLQKESIKINVSKIADNYFSFDVLWWRINEMTDLFKKTVHEDRRSVNYDICHKTIQFWGWIMDLVGFQRVALSLYDLKIVRWNCPVSHFIVIAIAPCA